MRPATCLLVALGASAAAEPTTAPTRELRDVLGVTHVAGSYPLTETATSRAAARSGGTTTAAASG